MISLFMTYNFLKLIFFISSHSHQDVKLQRMFLCNHLSQTIFKSFCILCREMFSFRKIQKKISRRGTKVSFDETFFIRLGSVAHTCNPSYLWSRDRKSTVQGQVRQVSVTLSQRTWVVAYAWNLSYARGIGRKSLFWDWFWVKHKRQYLKTS
jgi:hypothetical protein